MRVRVTIAREFVEYADIMVDKVESIEEAVATVKAQLTDAPAARTRLLSKLSWLRGDVISEIAIVESGNAD